MCVRIQYYSKLLMGVKSSIVKLGVEQEQFEDHKQGDQHSRTPLRLPAQPPLEMLTFFAHCMCHSGIIAIGSSGPIAPLAPDALY